MARSEADTIMHAELPHIEEASKASASTPEIKLHKGLLRQLGGNVLAVLSTATALTAAAIALRATSAEMAIKNMSFSDARHLQEKINRDLAAGKISPDQAAADRQKVTEAAKRGQRDS